MLPVAISVTDHCHGVAVPHEPFRSIVLRHRRFPLGVHLLLPAFRDDPERHEPPELFLKGPRPDLINVYVQVLGQQVDLDLVLYVVFEVPEKSGCPSPRIPKS